MNKTPVTAIFDIGKTNKKFFLFDENYREVFKEYIFFDEIKDDDGDACDNLPAIQNWVKDLLSNALKDERFEVRSVNFSTYGASFVHVDGNGVPVAPLYNYLKPYPKKILQSFYKKYGDETKIALETASPALGMLNSGLQLYWLKYTKPDIFKKIKWSLHFPQYMSYLFSGTPASEFSSIGSHTSLWDYNKNDYHDWVYAEEIDKILPPIVATSRSFKMEVDGKLLKIGSGIHDSSSALLPYVLSEENPFLLISTGTWSISLNPFSDELLTKDDLENDCLNYMRTDGKVVRASRLLLGLEYNSQVEKLVVFFNKEKRYDKTVEFDEKIFEKILNAQVVYFHFENTHLMRLQPDKTNFENFENFEDAYHQLMYELVELQVQSANRAIGNTGIRQIYIDGGFADNEIYIKILAHSFPQYVIYSTQSPLGSALGAAMIISGKKTSNHFLKEYYEMQKHDI